MNPQYLLLKNKDFKPKCKTYLTCCFKNCGRTWRKSRSMRQGVTTCPIPASAVDQSSESSSESGMSQSIGHRQVFPSGVVMTIRLEFDLMGRTTVTACPLYLIDGSCVIRSRAPALSFLKDRNRSSPGKVFCKAGSIDWFERLMYALVPSTRKPRLCTCRMAHRFAECSPSRGWKPR